MTTFKLFAMEWFAVMIGLIILTTWFGICSTVFVRSLIDYFFKQKEDYVKRMGYVEPREYEHSNVN